MMSSKNGDLCPSNPRSNPRQFNYLYVEGVSGAGKTTALKSLVCDKNVSVILGDLVSIDESEFYKQMVSHKCDTAASNNRCSQLAGCPGPNGIRIIYRAKYFEKIMAISTPYAIIDRHITISDGAYFQVGKLYNLMDAQNWTDLKQLPQTILDDAASDLRLLAEAHDSFRFLIVLNTDLDAVAKMKARGYFDVIDRTDQQVELYISIQNWVFGTLHTYLKHSILFNSDGIHYDLLSNKILSVITTTTNQLVRPPTDTICSSSRQSLEDGGV